MEPPAPRLQCLGAAPALSARAQQLPPRLSILSEPSESYSRALSQQAVCRKVIEKLFSEQAENNPSLPEACSPHQSHSAWRASPPSLRRVFLALRSHPLLGSTE